MRFPLLLLILVFFAAQATGQIPTIQDCPGAIPVCQQIYEEDLSPSGSGNYPNEINANISCTSGEINSIWYTFTVDQSGDFGFLITPNNLNDDYDWALFNITDASCADIFTDPSLAVSCNAAGGGTCNGLTGATGATNFNVQGGNCNNFPPTINAGFSAFNDLIPVEAGNTYVLMVSNWTGSTNGYTIDFGLSTGIGIFDQTPPEAQLIAHPVSCGEQTIDLLFSEYIDCATIGALNFQLDGPGGPYTLQLIGNGCDQGANFENVFSLIADPPISSMGTFTLQIQPEAGLPLQDLCGNPLAAVTLSFEVDQPIAIPVDIGNDTSVLCVGQTLTLNAFIQAGNYVWQDGSTAPTFLVDQPGLYAVTVTDACGTGNDSIGVTYLMTPPEVELGPDQVLCEGEQLLLDAANDLSIYSWQNGSTDSTFLVTGEGLYAVTVTNACGSVSDQLFVDWVPAISLDLGGDQVACEGASITLDAGNEEAVFLWQDGSTGPVFTAVETGVYSVTVTTACESQSQSVELIFIEEIAPELGQDTFLCAGDTILLDATVPGATFYLWQDGRPGPVYPVTQGGDYTVRIETVCNTFEEEIYIYFYPYISFDLGPDTYLCGTQVLLDAATAGPASYEWQDGTQTPLFIAREPGAYQVRVYNECESVRDTIYIKECEQCAFYFPNIFSPNFDGVNDTFRPLSECPPVEYLFRVFDRWGALVFETRDPAEGWDGTFRGKSVGAGAYAWWMSFTVIENNVPRSDTASGDVILIR